MRLDRLDRAALIFIAVLLAIIAVLLIRGDQVGVRVTRISPEPGASGVPTRAQLAFTFSEPMEAASLDGRIQMSPSLSGTLRWNGNTAFFAPQVSLKPDTAYTITLSAGARSIRGRAVLRDASWSFKTGHPRIVFLQPATGAGDLYWQEPAASATPQRLTSEPLSVFDYAISPDGRYIVYSATRDDTGARDLWLINADGSGRERLATCDDQVCQSPSWSADSALIAFERRNLIKGTLGRAPGPSRIWLFDMASKTIAPLLSDSQQLGTLPRWAPTGQNLAYYDSNASMVTVIDVASGQRTQLPSVMGDSGTWSPNGQQIIYPELVAVDVGSYSQLIRADLTRNVITATMPLSNSNDSSVTWSPDGAQIAFTRQRGGSGGFNALGHQIWVSAPDGSAARQVTTDTGYTYGGLTWRPDSEWLAAVRSNLQIPNPQPEVWLIRADGKQVIRLAVNATLPAWLP